MNRQVETRMGVATGQATRRGLARSLLRWAAEPYPSDRARQLLERELRTVDDQQLQHVIDAGLAPLLYHATCDTLEIVPAAWRDVLKSAEDGETLVCGADQPALDMYPVSISLGIGDRGVG